MLDLARSLGLAMMSFAHSVRIAISLIGFSGQELLHVCTGIVSSSSSSGRSTRLLIMLFSAASSIVLASLSTIPAPIRLKVPASDFKFLTASCSSSGSLRGALASHSEIFSVRVCSDACSTTSSRVCSICNTDDTPPMWRVSSSKSCSMTFSCALPYSCPSSCWSNFRLEASSELCSAITAAGLTPWSMMLAADAKSAL